MRLWLDPFMPLSHLYSPRSLGSYKDVTLSVDAFFPSSQTRPRDPGRAQRYREIYRGRMR